MGVWLALNAPAAAHTFVLDGAAIDRAAAIADDTPRMSWATYMPWTAVYYSSAIDLTVGRSMLIRIPLTNIPPGQRITSAELIVGVSYLSGTDIRFHLWRLLPDWGVGVSHLYRMTRPANVPWSVPGARGVAIDRAIQPTAIVRVAGVGEQVINVTEDVELWYAGGATNNGWLLTIEDPGNFVRLTSPFWIGGAEAWRLRVTYEPE
jgi:hypothetical protein